MERSSELQADIRLMRETPLFMKAIHNKTLRVAQAAALSVLLDKNRVNRVMDEFLMKGPQT